MLQKASSKVFYMQIATNQPNCFSILVLCRFCEVLFCRDANVLIECRVLPQQVEVPVLTKSDHRNHRGAVCRS